MIQYIANINYCMYTPALIHSRTQFYTELQKKLYDLQLKSQNVDACIKHNFI